MTMMTMMIIHNDHAHLNEKDCSQANSSSNTEGLQSRHSADRTYLLASSLERACARGQSDESD